MKILAIDTSCDETAAAVVDGRRVLSNVVYSQVELHGKWGGVVPSLAKRAHDERLPHIVAKALNRHHDIRAIAVTQGPGLAIALESGIKYAKHLAVTMNIPLVAVNHMEGHLYSAFVQNSQGNPPRDFMFPYIGVLVSGGHSEFVIWTDHLTYQVIGETVDDAAGEALDKAARLLGFGYPGGAVLERLAAEVSNVDKYKFTRPMLKSGDLNLSFSGLKTALLYLYRTLSEAERQTEIKYIASSFQEAVFDTIFKKLNKAMLQTGITNLTTGGGVVANQYFKKKLRSLAKSHKGTVLFPPSNYLTRDNAAMIGVVASYKLQRGITVSDIASLDRHPRMRLDAYQQSV